MCFRQSPELYTAATGGGGGGGDRSDRRTAADDGADRYNVPVNVGHHRRSADRGRGRRPWIGTVERRGTLCAARRGRH